MRGYLDRDFIQTTEGFFFCIVGAVHPPERVISYIKYVPSESGIWGTEQERFSRILQKYTIPNLIQTFNFIQENYPHYIFHSPADNITITAVPHQNIKKHFKPEQKLAELRKTNELDTLQQKLIRLTKLLEKTSNIDEEAFGITGSLLLDIHQPQFSDIDLNVYGVENSWELKDALTKNMSNITIKRLEGQALEEWCIKKSKDYPLTPADAANIYRRKWNLGRFENTWVSIHPIKLEKDVKEKYGQKTYIPVGHVTIQAVVSDNTESLFLPAVYQVKDVQVLEGVGQGPITEVVSYETLYDSLAQNG
ncbi:MAG: hypothetical protein NWF03_02550, partial [Candidatus Bathyarchaeota archaeon]|nr:hypothetical protein [Candidatus Bathyarchaeota archaeon]